MNDSISIVATGDELVTGKAANTNSTVIAKCLSDHYIRIGMHLVCIDDLKSITLAVKWLLENSKSIIITGGLGSTDDDLTRQVVADVVNCELEFNESVYHHLEQYLQNKNRVMIDRHKKLCFFPKDAVLFKNTIGTAWGFAVIINNDQWIYALPGPPGENQMMIQNSVLAHCLEFHLTKPYHKLSWVIHNVSEEKIASYFDLIKANHKVDVHTCVHNNKTCDVYFILDIGTWGNNEVKQLVEDINGILSHMNIKYEEHHKLI